MTQIGDFGFKTVVANNLPNGTVTGYAEASCRADLFRTCRHPVIVQSCIYVGIGVDGYFVLRMFRNHLFPGIHIDYTHNNDNIFGCFSTCNNNFDNRNNIGNRPRHNRQHARSVVPRSHRFATV